MMIGASLYTIKYLLVIIVMQALKKTSSAGAEIGDGPHKGGP